MALSLTMKSDDSWNQEGRYDDGAAALQLQTFLDDWHYRVLHAGMATEIDRNEAVMAALGLFEGIGLVVSPEEKEAMVLMEEDDMIDHAVHKMTPELTRNIEHFALQLQLIVSTATRVRGALEQDNVEEVTKIMEHGDAGITQHIMKRTVVEAAQEIVELKDVNDGWSKDMGSRLNRLSRLAEEQERNRIELDRVNAEIGAFHSRQNEKAVKAVNGIAAQNDATLLKTSFQGWMNNYIRWKGEKHIHEKYQAEIKEAEFRLKEMQGKSVGAIKRSLMNNADKCDELLQADVLRRWHEDVKREKAERADKLRLDAEMAHLECLRSDQKAAAKRNLMRMSDGNDESLITMCFTSWAKNKQEEKKQADFEQKEERLQKQLANMKTGSGGNAKGVLGRVSEQSTTGITGNVFVHWRDEAKSALRARNMEETITANEHKFKSLNAKQKGNANHAAQNAVDLQEDNELMMIFMNWHMEVQISQVASHYSGKMAGKKQQLEQVQSMFKDFTAALEQGISTTPRTEKKSGSRVKSGEKPPALPSGGQEGAQMA